MADNSSLLVPRFFMHVSPNEVASKAKGRPIFDEFEAIEIRFGGDRQKAAVFPAHELDPNATRERGEPTTYAMVYNDLYRKFKSNETQDLAGTPLAELPFLTEGKRRELKALNIHTAEALASLDGTPLKQLGMGGREMKNQAKAYLDNAAGSADVTALASQVEALQQQIKERDELISNMSTVRTAKTYQKETRAMDRRIEADVAAEQDDEGNEGETPPIDPASEDEDQSGDGDENTPSPFQDWEDEDIKNWLADTTGSKPKGNPNHATLVRLADEANAKAAEQNDA